MFVRRLKHKNGLTYIQVIDKVRGKYKVCKSFVSCSTSKEIEERVLLAEQWIAEKQALLEFDFNNESGLIEKALDSITALRLVGIELVLGRIFDEIGFNEIKDVLFRDLVLYRLVYPKSKLKTTEYLARFEQKHYTEDDIYRYMDKLHATQKELVQQISYRHTQQILNGPLQVVFYDVTTIYFEVDQEDELRKTGFSKEGKHQHPQIVLGLLVSKGGYPLAYEIFEGNQFEGHTMLPIVDAFRTKYQIDSIIVVADSGLMSAQNIEQLKEKGYEFIIGARIKSEKQTIKNRITSLKLKNGESTELLRDDLRLIVTFAESRARKDRMNREKGLGRLEKQIRRGNLTKANINNRGYNKFLSLEGEISVRLNPEKIEEDQRWDGLKGYITNSTLSKEELLENYNHLWQIEKAFRIAKSELRIRPIYHYKRHRIEAHICLNFVAYKIYKELERQLTEKGSALSPEKVIEILQSIYQIELSTLNTRKIVKRTLILTKEHKQVAAIFDFGC